MATIFRVKRSETAGNPSTLAQGELAYSALADNGSNGGDRLYIGMGTESGGNAANHIVVGGKFFTDMLDHTAGTLTANSALIVDADGKIDVFNVDNLTLDGNTLSSTDTNGNIVLDPNGSGVVSVSNAKISDLADPTLAQDAVTFSFLESYVASGGAGAEATQDVVGDMVTGNTENGISVVYDDTLGKLNFDVADFTITADGDMSGSVTITDLASGTLTLTLDDVNANVGSFGSATAIPTFTVNSKGLVTAAGEVSVATTLTLAADSGSGDGVDLLTDTLSIVGGEGIDTSIAGDIVTITGEDASAINKGVASFDATDFTVTAGNVVVNTITVGTSELNAGETTASLAGLQSLAVDNVTIDGNTISTTNTNGDLLLAPNGTGQVNVNGAVLTGLGTPTQSTDAVTKEYADALATGLDAKESVRAATTAAITLANTQTVDGVALADGDRVLVKDQADASTNGIYTVVDGAAWTRATDFDEPYEVSANVYAFVEEGTVNGDNGFVLVTDDPITLGTSDLTFVQFSGAGQVVAGAGLTKTGNQIDIVATDGIVANADSIALNSGVAGAGLTFTSGVVDVVGTANRISVAADSIDIAATYVGQTSINTLGTVTTGTWQGDVVSVTYGGTGVSNPAARSILIGNGTSAMTVLAGSDTDASFLKQDATGNPVWTNEIDGGTY